MYAEHWAGHRPVEITIEEDQIVIRRAGGGEDEDEDSDARARAIAWRHAEHARICDVIEPHEYGTSVQCTFMPTFWHYNSLRVEGPDPGVSADALVRAADVAAG